MDSNVGAQKLKHAVERKVANLFKFMEQLAEKGRLEGGKPLRKLQADVLKKMHAYVESNHKG